MSPLSIIFSPKKKVKKLSCLNQERNMHRSSPVYKWKQSKTVLNKYFGWFWCERTTGDRTLPLEEALLWVMNSYFSQKWRFEVKNALMMDLYLTNETNTSVYQFAQPTNSCSHKIQSINVCLQNHLWLCTSLPKFITLDLCAPLEAYILQVNVALLCIPTRYKITFTDFYIKCFLLVEWPAQLNPSSWVLSHLQESAKNTSLPSLFDPLTLALSILILFYLSVFLLKKTAVTAGFSWKSFSWKTNTSFLFSILSTCFFKKQKQKKPH